MKIYFQFIYKYLCLFLVSFVLLQPIDARTNNFLFKQLGVAEGFPAYINTVCAEESGFIWIGTKDGLSKFDGYRLKKYTHQENDLRSLPDNEIIKIVEDSLHNIWILTNKGIARYISQTDNFDIPKNEEGENIVANSVRKTSGGVIFGMENQIYHYSYKTSKLENLLKFKRDENYLINDLWQWDDSTILCLNVWQDLLLLDLNNKKIKPSPFDQLKNISRVLLDSEGHVWCASYNEGITCFDRQGNELASYNTSNSSLSNDLILSMVEHNGEIWIGTDGGGINVLNPKTKNIITLEHRSGDINSLPTNAIQSLDIDNNDIWAGTIRGGLINIRKSFIRSYSDVTLNTSRGLSDKTVLAFYQDSTSNFIWIGTDGGGINRFDPNNQAFKHYPQTWKEKVTSICGYTKDELLVTIFSKGIFIFNKHTGTLRIADQKNNEIQQLTRYGRRTVNLYQNEPNSALLMSSSIYEYNFKSKNIEKLTDSSFEPNGVILAIGDDDSYTYLYDRHQIYTLNRKNKQLQTIYADKKHQITCMSRDKDGIFWIGMKDMIYRYDPKTKERKIITNDLLKDIRSLICDRNNQVWIGTNEILLVLKKETGKLMIFGESDGVMPNEYLDKSILESKIKDIYMGGVNGMIHIHNTLPSYTSNSPQMVLTEVLSNGSNVMPMVNTEKQEIELDSNSKTVTLKVMAKDDDIFRKRIYKFKITGQEELILENYLPEITLHSLSSGTYSISASCSTKEGEWSTANHILKFTILKPWFQTWWFIMLCVVIIVGLFVFAGFMYLNHKKNQLTFAMQKHTQQMYEEKVRFLININHELRTPLTLIYAPLNLILNSISSSEKIYDPLRNAFKQAKRMKKLLNMTLNLRKMEVGDNKLNMQNHNLNAWIKDIANDYVYEEKEHQITINYDLSSSITDLSFDNEKSIIILTNLLDNAFKYSPPGGILTLRTELVRDNRFVRISVIDQGNGLPEGDVEKLFTRFHQGPNNKGGIGVGLSYAKILVEQQEGVIGAYNNEDRGATFFYELPLEQRVGEVISQQKEYINEVILTNDDLIEKQTSLVDLIDTNKYSLLFVDDNKDLQTFIQHSLQEHFSRLYIASNGQEALDIALREIPDIIISDVMMPIMNGYELCIKIKENQNINHIQVILLTARTDKQSHMDGYITGADAYLEKPVEVEMLLTTIRNRLFLREQVKIRYTNYSIPIADDIHLTSSDDTFMFKLNKIINENMENKELNIKFISQEIGMSRASLYNKLKSLTDMGANEYINRIRMEKAIVLLTQTDLSISDIAHQTGFSSPKYFSTVFKLYTEKTPTQYKEEFK